MNKMTISIDENNAIVIDYLEKGIMQCKAVSHDSLLEAIKQSVRTDLSINSGILPANCLGFSIRDDGVKRYVIEHLDRFADVTYFQTAYTNFPLPRLIFGFTLNESNKIISTSIGVVEDKVTLSESTKMYHYPLSNVNGFHMCVGANSLPELKKISALNNIPNYLFSLPDNDDYYNSNCNKLDLNHRELLEELKDKSPEYYYSNVLIESRKTLKHFM